MSGIDNLGEYLAKASVRGNAKVTEWADQFMGTAWYVRALELAKEQHVFEVEREKIFQRNSSPWYAG